MQETRRRRLRRALVRGGKATWWLHRDDCLFLLHPNGDERIEVPVAHLVHEERFFEHVLKLEAQRWVPAAAIDELRLIRSGARQ